MGKAEDELRKKLEVHRWHQRIELNGLMTKCDRIRAEHRSQWEHGLAKLVLAQRNALAIFMRVFSWSLSSHPWLRAYSATGACPCASAKAMVISVHGQLRSRKNCSTSNRPAAAALAHTLPSQPLAMRASRKICRCPQRAAAPATARPKGQLHISLSRCHSSYSHLSESSAPSRAAASIDASPIGNESIRTAHFSFRKSRTIRFLLALGNGPPP